MNIFRFSVERRLCILIKYSIEHMAIFYLAFSLYNCWLVKSQLFHLFLGGIAKVKRMVGKKIRILCK